MFRKNLNVTIGQEIQNAQRVVDNAMGVFKTSLLNLIDANATLSNICISEEDKISEHRTNIDIARTKMLSNEATIKKLKDFLPQE